MREYILDKDDRLVVRDEDGNVLEANDLFGCEWMLTLIKDYNAQDARIKELVAECEKRFFTKGEDDVNNKRMQMYNDAYNKNSVDPRAAAIEAVEAFDKMFGTGGVS